MCPKNSELVFCDWLKDIGCTDIRYVGGESGPPDFVANYMGDTVAIEGSRMLDSRG